MPGPLAFLLFLSLIHPNVSLGELPQLDMRLSADSIKGIQWKTGASTPAEQDWAELYEIILSSGKELVSCTQTGWTSDRYSSKSGELYFGEESFDAAKDMPTARRHGEIYDIEVQTKWEKRAYE